MPVRTRIGVVYKALADPTRRRILDALKRGPRTTGQLARRFPRLSRFAVMKHLAVLERANLVLVRRDGRTRWNHLNAVPLRQVYDRWVSSYASHCAGSLVRLKQFVETQSDSKGDTAMTEVAPSGQAYQIEQELQIRAPRTKVFDALTRDVEHWWAFRGGLPGAKLILEPFVGGRFYEDLGDGEGALYGTVAYIQRPEKLRLTGPLGIKTPVIGVYVFELSDADGGTLLKLSHRIFGDVPPDVAENYRNGWGKLLNRYLKGWCEDGKSFRKIDQEAST